MGNTQSVEERYRAELKGMDNNQLGETIKRIESEIMEIKKTKQKESGIVVTDEERLYKHKLLNDFRRTMANSRGGFVPNVSFIAQVQKKMDELNDVQTTSTATLGWTVLYVSAITSITFIIEHFRHHWGEEDFWVNLIAGLCLQLGVGSFVGGLANAISYAVEIALSRFGLILTSLDMKSIVYRSLVSWTVSSLWTFFYDFLYKQHIDLKEMAFDVFISNAISSFANSVLALACGPLGLGSVFIYIAGSVIISLIVSEYFFKRSAKKEKEEFEEFIEKRLNISRDEEDSICDCEINLCTVRDPVFLNGRLYEREAITRHIQEKGTCPFGQTPAGINDLSVVNGFSELCNKFRLMAEERNERVKSVDSLYRPKKV